MYGILNDLGRWGWLAAFVTWRAALRLARFNTNIAVSTSDFQGLPSRRRAGGRFRLAGRGQQAAHP